MKIISIKTKNGLIEIGRTNKDANTIKNKLETLNLEELSEDILELKELNLAINNGEDAFKLYDSKAEFVVNKYNLFKDINKYFNFIVNTESNDNKNLIHRTKEELDKWYPNYSYSNKYQDFRAINFYIPEFEVVIKEKDNEDFL